MKRLEVTVQYANGTAEVLPDPLEANEIGRKVTGYIAWEFMARDDVLAVSVNPVERVAGGRRGTYR